MYSECYMPVDIIIIIINSFIRLLCVIWRPLRYLDLLIVTVDNALLFILFHLLMCFEASCTIMFMYHHTIHV